MGANPRRFHNDQQRSSIADNVGVYHLPWPLAGFVLRVVTLDGAGARHSMAGINGRSAHNA